MCGIAGSLRWQHPDIEALIQTMTRALAHRGPDAEHCITLGPLVLGHRRLSIIDTAHTADQPMTDHSKAYWIVFNGEIYNYKDLRATLLKSGHQFNTESDTEVILEAYKKWGINCLQHFVGMFAFALWDKTTETLVLARDRMGEKPLYYQLYEEQGNTNIVFASELNALKLHPKVSRDINFKALSQFLSLNYILTDAAIFEGVKKLPPAHYLTLRMGQKPLLKEYWKLATYFNQKSNYHRKNDAIDALQTLLQSSVSQQTISDVPLGSFLSGGIDSSSIVASMTRQQDPQWVNTFSIGFKEKSFSELKESQIVANYLKVSHNTQIVDADMASTLPKIIAAMDEPFADTSMIPMYFLSQFSRKKVKVCLSGDGGDELFAGYETYVANKLYHLSQYIPKPILQCLRKGIDTFLPVSHKKLSFDYKLKQFLKGTEFPYQYAHYYWRIIFNDQEKQALLNPEFHHEIMQYNPFESFEEFYKDVLDCHPLDQASYVDMKTWMVDDILYKVDRSSMAHSLEARAPFLDHRLVEFAASLPVNWKLKHFEKKHLLKLSQHPYLPKTTLYRPKKGFSAPISQWFSESLQPLAREVTQNTSLMAWFNPKAIQQLWQEHLNKHQDHGLKLFGLTCLGLWLDKAKRS